MEHGAILAPEDCSSAMFVATALGRYYRQTRCFPCTRTSVDASPYAASAPGGTRTPNPRFRSSACNPETLTVYGFTISISSKSCDLFQGFSTGLVRD